MSGPRRLELVVPELGLADRPLWVSLWLAPLGGEVAEGESVVELCAGGVTVELPAPAGGVLAERRVEEDEPVQVGQVLGVIVSHRTAIR